MEVLVNPTLSTTRGNPAVSGSYGFGSPETEGGIFSQFFLSSRLILSEYHLPLVSPKCHVNLTVSAGVA